MVVIHGERVEGLLAGFDRVEQCTVEDLVTEAPVKALDASVVGRFTGPTALVVDVVGFEKALCDLGDKLASVVAAQPIWSRVPLSYRLSENGDDGTGFERAHGDRDHDFSAKLIDDREDAKPFAGNELLRREVECPPFIYVRCRTHRIALDLSLRSDLAPSRYREFRGSADAENSREREADASSAQHGVKSPVAKPGVLLRQSDEVSAVERIGQTQPLVSNTRSAPSQHAAGTPFADVERFADTCDDR